MFRNANFLILTATRRARKRRTWRHHTVDKIFLGRRHAPESQLYGFLYHAGPKYPSYQICVVTMYYPAMCMGTIHTGGIKFDLTSRNPSYQDRAKMSRSRSHGARMVQMKMKFSFYRTCLTFRRSCCGNTGYAQRKSVVKVLWRRCALAYGRHKGFYAQA